MTRRYYSAEPIQNDAVALTDAEAHHLLHVLRAAPGDHVTLFDGSGCEFEAEVTAARRASVELRVLARHEVDRELPFPLEIAAPFPKGDRQRWMIEKAVELGVSTLVPLETQRSLATSDRATGAAVQKLIRYVIEASKQCGRNRLMKIAPPATWSQWLASAEDVASHKWIAAPGGDRLTSGMPADGSAVYATVGPEGGLSAAELDAAAAAGWRTVSLGDRILRVETAVLAIATLAAQPR